MNKEAQNNNNNRVIQLFNEHLKDPKYKTEICKNYEMSFRSWKIRIDYERD